MVIVNPALGISAIVILGVGVILWLINLYYPSIDPKYSNGILISCIVVSLILISIIIAQQVRVETYQLSSKDKKCNRRKCTVNNETCFDDQEKCERFRDQERGYMDDGFGNCIPTLCILGEDDNCYFSLASCTGTGGYMYTSENGANNCQLENNSERCRGSDQCFDDKFECNVYYKLITGAVYGQNDDKVECYETICDDYQNCYVNDKDNCNPVQGTIDETDPCHASIEVCGDNQKLFNGYLFSNKTCIWGLCNDEKCYCEDIVTGDINEDCRVQNNTEETIENGATDNAYRWCLFDNGALGGYEYFPEDNKCNEVEQCEDFDYCFDSKEECSEVVESLADGWIFLIILTSILFIVLLGVFFWSNYKHLIDTDVSDTEESIKLY